MFTHPWIMSLRLAVAALACGLQPVRGAIIIVNDASGGTGGPVCTLREDRMTKITSRAGPRRISRWRCAPEEFTFAAQYPAWAYPCQRFASALAGSKA